MAAKLARLPLDTTGACGTPALAGVLPMARLLRACWRRAEPTQGVTARGLITAGFWRRRNIVNGRRDVKKGYRFVANKVLWRVLSCATRAALRSSQHARWSL